MKSFGFIALLLLACSAPLLAADDEDIVRIIAAKERPISAFASEVVKSKPRAFRPNQDAGSGADVGWDEIARLLSDRIHEISGRKLVVSRPHDYSVVQSLNKLRKWLLDGGPSYFNLSRAIILEITIVRSSLAFLAEDGAPRLDVAKEMQVIEEVGLLDDKLYELAVVVRPVSKVAAQLRAQCLAGEKPSLLAAG